MCMHGPELGPGRRETDRLKEDIKDAILWLLITADIYLVLVLVNK